MGIRFEQRGDDLYIPSQEHYGIESFIDGSIMTIADAPWPGLTPDLLSIFLVVATQARGSVLIHQKMFESRLFFVDKLIDMGAQIILCDPHRATVIGHDHRIRLRATRMTSPDIRAGVSAADRRHERGGMQHDPEHRADRPRLPRHRNPSERARRPHYAPRRLSVKPDRSHVSGKRKPQGLD